DEVAIAITLKPLPELILLFHLRSRAIAKAAARAITLSFKLATDDFFDACVGGAASLLAAPATIMANDIAAGRDAKAAAHPGVIKARVF
nr:hypothetical protein [Tanacetum cinerariifolium]